MNNFITSTALLTDKLLSSNFDPELKEFLSIICENLKTKDAQLFRLQNEIEYLREKVNDVERYTPILLFFEINLYCQTRTLPRMFLSS